MTAEELLDRSPAPAGGNPYQRTAEWLAERCGYLTASQAYPVLTRAKRGGGWLAAREETKTKIMVERLTGNYQVTPVTGSMQWGVDHEDAAREAYESATGELVELVGFVKHPAIPWLGASPDGLVGDEGLVEIKCPNSVTHLNRIRAGVVEPLYVPQMLVQLLCTGRKWVDFVDFDPRFPERMRLLVVRFEPTAEQLAEAQDLCTDFLAEVEEEINLLKEKNYGINE